MKLSYELKIQQELRRLADARFPSISFWSKYQIMVLHLPILGLSEAQKEGVAIFNYSI